VGNRIKNVKKFPNIPYSAMVKKMEMWSRIHLQMWSRIHMQIHINIKN